MRTVWSVLGLIAKSVTVWLSFCGFYTYIMFWVDLWHLEFVEAGVNLCSTLLYCGGTLASLYVGLKYDELVQGKHKALAEVVHLHTKKSALRKAA